jgi:hypothetical protein
MSESTFFAHVRVSEIDCNFVLDRLVSQLDASYEESKGPPSFDYAIASELNTITWID